MAQSQTSFQKSGPYAERTKPRVRSCKVHGLYSRLDKSSEKLSLTGIYRNRNGEKLDAGINIPFALYGTKAAC
jgi:hypothetical protein